MLVYFYPKKHTINVKNYGFLTLILLIKILVWTPLCTETVILHLFCLWKYEITILKSSFNLFAKFLRTACTAQIAHFWLKLVTWPGFCLSFLNISLPFVEKSQPSEIYFNFFWGFYSALSKKFGSVNFHSCKFTSFCITQRRILGKTWRQKRSV